MKTTIPAALVIAIAVSGCTAEAKRMTLPDGKQGFFVSCDQGNTNWPECYEQAAKSCGGKFKVIDRSESSTPTPWGPLVKRNMIVDCGG